MKTTDTIEKNKTIIIKKVGTNGEGGWVSGALISQYKNMLFPKSQHTLPCQLSKNGGYNTGLTIEDEVYFEEQMGLVKGTLKRNNAAFWGEFVLFKCKGTDIRLNLDSVENQLKYKCILKHTKVANSMVDLATNPDAEYVIADEETEAVAKNTKDVFVRKAWAKFDTMTTEEHKEVLKIVGKHTLNSTKPAVLEAAVSDYLKDNPEKFLSIINDPKLKTKVLIQDLLSAGILRINGTHYIHGDEPIGHDLESTVIFLEDLKNSNVLVNLQASLNKKNKEK
jgi:hypothetical protein